MKTFMFMNVINTYKRVMASDVKHLITSPIHRPGLKVSIYRSTPETLTQLQSQDHLLTCNVLNTLSVAALFILDLCLQVSNYSCASPTRRMGEWRYRNSTP